MDWVRTHLTTSLSLIAGLLLVCGTIVVIERAPAQPRGAQAWGGTLGNFQSPQAYTPNPVLSTTQPTYGAQSPNFLPIAPSVQPGSDNTASDSDLASLLAQLSGASKNSTDADGFTLDASGYDFIPQGLIATTTFQVKRTPTQQALYQYGNEVGSYIQSYEARTGNVPQILKDQIEDRGNVQKGQAVKGVGAALIYIGTQMESVEDVPPGTEGMHLALAKSYQEIGKKLQVVPDAQGDQAFIASIESYNAAADQFTKNYVALANFFALSEVKFSSSDPGVVFMFSGGGGL